MVDGKGTQLQYLRVRFTYQHDRILEMHYEPIYDPALAATNKEHDPKGLAEHMVFVHYHWHELVETDGVFGLEMLFIICVVSQCTTPCYPAPCAAAVALHADPAGRCLDLRLLCVVRSRCESQSALAWSCRNFAVIKLRCVHDGRSRRRI